MSSTTETYEFQTEARQLLDLMIHSVYSNKDIFLRELISNSSDALDKLRIESLRDPEVKMPEEPQIRIDPDRGARTLSVVDNGIGMTREEIIMNIGTIAKSGTKEFLTAMRAGENGGAPAAADLIGQFGVGFYSTFMVADRVTLLTRRAGEDTAWLWESTGDGTYTLVESHRPTSGTTVTLHLKPVDTENALNDYTEEWTIRSIVKKYSDFVTYPIRMRVERQEKAETEGGESKSVVNDETLNSMKALWRRPKEQVSAEEYGEFYKHISHDWTDPLETIYIRAEGTFEYYAILFIPSKAPFDLFHQEGKRGLQLYVKRVFIMEDAEELLPLYLRFVRGVVDAEDLSLNISREILQQNRQIQQIRKRLTAKVIETLTTMKTSAPEKYRTFWAEFGRVLKEGTMQEPEQRKAILDISYFRSTASSDLTTIADYIGRMKEGQSDIYYITGEDASVLASSPHLEAFVARGYEVLLLTDPIDELWTTSQPDIDGRKLSSVTRSGVDLGSEEEKKEAEEKKRESMAQHGAVLMAIKEALGDKVKEVRLSDRLTSSAACLTTDQGELSPQLERLMRAMGQDAPETKRVMELNPSHAVLRKLQEIYDRDSASPLLDEYAELLYGQALLAEGGQLHDPARFSRLVADLMVKA